MGDIALSYTRTEDGFNIAYASLGSGPPMVFVPEDGGGLYCYEAFPSWGRFMERLAEQRQLVLFDWRGQGASPHTPDVRTTLDTWVADLDAAVRAVHPDSKVLLWASWGASVTALAYAARVPERVAGAVLFCPVARGADWVGSPEAQAFQRPDRGDFETFAAATASWLAGFEDADAAAEIAAAMRKSNPEKRINLSRSIAGMDASADLPNVRCPVLVLHRRGVRTPDIDRVRDLTVSLQNARLVELEGRSPIAWVGDSDSVLRITDEFVASLPATESTAAPIGQGFRTILFTDVVASTPLLAQLKDARMREVMRDHDAVLQAAVDEHGGRVVKEIGDAFMAEFAVPSAAVACAIAMQRGIQAQFADTDVPIRLRIGINAGEPVEEDGDLYGASVVIAKRLESAAAENGILVSEVVKQAVAGKDFAFAAQGDFDLKGFDEPVRAWSVEWTE